MILNKNICWQKTKGEVFCLDTNCYLNKTKGEHEYPGSLFSQNWIAMVCCVLYSLPQNLSQRENFSLVKACLTFSPETTVGWSGRKLSRGVHKHSYSLKSSLRLTYFERVEVYTPAASFILLFSKLLRAGHRDVDVQNSEPWNKEVKMEHFYYHSKKHLSVYPFWIFFSKNGKTKEHKGKVSYKLKICMANSSCVWQFYDDVHE